MRRIIATAVAIVTASAVVLPTGAAAADIVRTPEIAATTVRGEVGYRVADRSALPVVESEIGRGHALSTTPGATVALGAAVDGFGAALVRVAALSADADTTVFRSGGVPALEARAGSSASTALLLPVHDGAVQLWASAPVDARIEVLAAFESDPTLPGAMIALDEPVLRADTGAGLAATTVGTREVPVNAVGRGGVPSSNVRAIWATLVVTADRATTIVTGGQRLPVGAGRTAMTTILPLDADGAVDVRSTEGPVHLQLYVAGWIPDEPDFASQLHLPGSYAVSADITDGGVVELRDAQPAPVSVSRHVDAAYSIAMVAATDATETTFLDVGPEYDGRGRGAVVDAAAGAVPQLVVTAAGGEDALTLRRGAATVSWAPVGDILGEERPILFAAPPEISIDSHDHGHDVDLGDHGYFTLSGTIDAPGASVDRVEISGPDGLIGNADVRRDEDGIHWSFDAAAPEDGTFTFTATVYDRAGHAHSDDVQLDIVAVSPDDIVTAPDVHVFNETPSQQWLHVVTDTEVMVDVEPRFGPGDILVGAVSEATPEGLFVRVVAIDRIGERWRVHVEEASLTDAFFQADIDQVHPLDDPTAIVPNSDPDAVPEPVTEDGEPIAYPEVEYLDGDGDRVWVVPAEEVDLSDIPADETDPMSARMTTAADATPLSAALGIQANLLIRWRSDNVGTPTITEMSKAAATPEEGKRILESRYKEVVDQDTTALALALQGQATADLTFVFRSHITWKWGFIPTGVVVDEITLKLVATLKLSATVKFSVGTKVSNTTWNALGGFKLPTLTFAIGPVPVTITNDVGMGLEFSYSLEGRTSLPEFSYKRVYTYGFTYTDREGYSTLSKEPESSGKWGIFDGLDGADFSAAGNVGYGPVINAKSMLYGAAGPELSLAGQVKLELATGLEHYQGHWRAYLRYRLVLAAEFSGKVKIAFSLFGKKLELGEAKLFRLTAEYPLLSGRWTTDEMARTAGIRAVISQRHTLVKNAAGHGARSDV